MPFSWVRVPGLKNVKHSEFIKTNEVYLHYKKMDCRVLLTDKLLWRAHWNNITHNASESNSGQEHIYCAKRKRTRQPQHHSASGPTMRSSIWSPRSLALLSPSPPWRDIQKPVQRLISSNCATCSVHNNLMNTGQTGHAECEKTSWKSLMVPLPPTTGVRTYKKCLLKRLTFQYWRTLLY